MKASKLIKYLVETQLKDILKYPNTAEEYAKQINSTEPDSVFKLVEDPEHWASVGVYTGHDLAHALAVQYHSDTYKDIHGIRPRWMEYGNMSVEDIEKETEMLMQEPPPYDYSKEYSDAHKEEDEENLASRKEDPNDYEEDWDEYYK
jgi:hypothetical protein